ncbi:N-acyl-D-amino-acid deacylase family protein [Anaerosphaera multitolerans]|nr:D-aminoacylase [Anaerosphaera multitolerans]
MFDVLIKNGLIVDGTGEKPYEGNLAIVDEKIKLLGKGEEVEAKKVIDAKGKVVSPGFIDTHSHSSLLVFQDPMLSPKTRQGITTEFVAQDGMGPAPIDEPNKSSWIKAMSGLEGEYEAPWDWESVDDYLNVIDKLDLGPNIAYLAPHSNVRFVSMGMENRQATDEELKKMKENLAKAMEEGAFGLSTGLIYPPGSFGNTKELVELGKVLAETGGVFVTHQRSEADSILDSMDEILTVGNESGCRIHFSHFKVCGKNNWDKIPAVLEKLDNFTKAGRIVSYDQYPYVAGSTMMSVILPPWVHDGGTDKLLERLQDNELREKMKEDILTGIEGWDNFVEFAGFDGIFVTFVGSDKNKDVEGKSLTEIGQMRGKEPLDAIFDIILEEKNLVGLVDFWGTEEHVVRLLKRPEQNVCTDGILGGKPHPRVYGAFPRVIGKYVREEEALTLEEAIYKMTKKPAETFGLYDRGVIKDGYAADLVIFDFEEIRDVGDYNEPNQYPKGIEYVLVNGKVIIDNGEATPQKAGKVLRFKGRK